MAGYSKCSFLKAIGTACSLLVMISFIGHRFRIKLENVSSFSYSSPKCEISNGKTFFMSNSTSNNWNAGKTKLSTVIYQPLGSYANKTHLKTSVFGIERANLKCIESMLDIIRTSVPGFFIGSRRTYIESTNFSTGLETCPPEPPNVEESPKQPFVTEEKI